jgi:hypothetical protein
MKETIVTIYNPFTDPLMVMATYCPTCGKPAKTYEEAEDIRGLGECLRCDHVRGEVTDDLHDEAVENWDGETSEDKWFADAGVDSSFEEDR